MCFIRASRCVLYFGNAIAECRMLFVRARFRNERSCATSIQRCSLGRPAMGMLLRCSLRLVWRTGIGQEASKVTHAGDRGGNGYRSTQGLQESELRRNPLISHMRRINPSNDAATSPRSPSQSQYLRSFILPAWSIRVVSRKLSRQLVSCAKSLALSADLTTSDLHRRRRKEKAEARRNKIQRRNSSKSMICNEGCEITFAGRLTENPMGGGGRGRYWILSGWTKWAAF